MTVTKFRTRVLKCLALVTSLLSLYYAAGVFSQLLPDPISSKLVNQLTTTALADDSSGPIKIELTSVSPQLASSSDTVTVEGKVTNVSDSAITSLRAHLWRRTTPLDSAQIEQLLLPDAELPIGTRLVSYSRGQAVWLPTAENPSLEPGESASFKLAAPISGDYSLNLNDTNAVYLVGVQVRGSVDYKQVTTLAQSAVMLPVLDDETKIGQVATVLLTAAPDLLDPQAGENLADELSGRLDTLLDFAETPNVTALIDPALYLAASQLADPEISTAPEADQLTAKSWLSRVDKLAGRGTVYRTQFAMADIFASTEAGYSDGFSDQIRAMADPELAELLVSNLPLVIVSLDGQASSALVEESAQLEPVAVLASNVQPGLSEDSGIKVIGLSEDFKLGGPGSGTSTSHQLGRLYSSQLFSAHPLVNLVQDVDDLKFFRHDSHLAQIALADLLDIAAVEQAQWVASDLVPKSTSWQQSFGQLSRSFAAWRSLTGETRPSTAQAQTAAKAWSHTWSSDSQASKWITIQRQDVDTLMSSEFITLSVADQFTVGSSESQIPLTVTNNLDTDISLRLRFRSNLPPRLSIPDTEVVTIEAGHSQTVIAKPSAHGNATVEVTAIIETPDGHQVGASSSFTIDSSDFGNLGWLLIIVTGAVFLGGTAFRIRQIQRQKKKLDTDTDEPDEPTSGRDAT